MRRFFARFDLFVNTRTYWLLVLVFLLFVAAYVWPVIFSFSKIFALILAFLACADFLILIAFSNPIFASRTSSEKWSLGDENKIGISIKNNTFFAWFVSVLDELPIELQVRHFKMDLILGTSEFRELDYQVKPLRRGALQFGKIRVFIKTPLSFFSRRCSFDQNTKVSVYPSILQMKKYSLFTVNKLAVYYGLKKMRRLGHSYEFEQIKDYVQGDDLRHINWRATGRTQSLKTNHFMEERAQPVYCILDKSRNMNQAFSGMSVLDYAINTSLVISNNVLLKGDKAGLITFSNKVGTAIRADSGSGVLQKIMDNLYYQKYRQSEPDFEFLFNAINRIINNRSLLFLFTNFDSLNAMDRVLPILRKINQNHLLVVILFQNDEIEKYAYEASNNLREIYNRMIARQMLDDKRQMVARLQTHGIQCIATTPADLTINTLNKYVELKAKGLI